MLIELRSYILHPGGQSMFLEMMETEGIVIEAPILGGLVGYYSSEIGELNKIVHLWAYESHDERERRRALLAADPAWRAFVPKVLPLIRHMSSEILTPARFSPTPVFGLAPA